MRPRPDDLGPDGTGGLPRGLGRALWLADPEPPEGFARSIATDPGAKGPFDAVVLDDLAGRPGECRAWQARLRPGGHLVVLAARHPRRLARRLRPFFEGGPPGPRERFRPVRAQGRRVAAQRRGPGMALGHFDDLAEEYAAELPAHLVEHYRERKLAVLRAALASAHRPPEQGLRGTRGLSSVEANESPVSPESLFGRGLLGLDLGCGVGEYARASATGLGARVVALDASAPAVAVARGKGTADRRVAFAAGDAQRLPFPDATFDFAYAINMVHHLKRGEQEAAVAEALRVLKPGAPLVVFEINVTNPLFRLYMRKVFPRTRRIDRGDEEFLTPRAFRRAVAPARVEAVAYSTFVPDFTPRWLLPALRPIERLLERVAGPLGIHYAAVLRR